MNNNMNQNNNQNHCNFHGHKHHHIHGNIQFFIHCCNHGHNHCHNHCHNHGHNHCHNHGHNHGHNHEYNHEHKNNNENNNEYKNNHEKKIENNHNNNLENNKMNNHPNNSRYNQNLNDINNHNFDNINDKRDKWNNNINKVKKDEKANENLFNNDDNNKLKINENNMNNINNFRNNQNNINRNDDPSLNNFLKDPNIINQNNKKRKSEDIAEINRFLYPSAKGLVNVGATCYMNATIQCLAHIIKLTKYLLNVRNINKIVSDKNKYKLTNSYIEILNNIWLNYSINYYSPDNFKNIISEMNPLFAGIQANDSKDLVLFILETMHNELNEPKNMNEINEITIQNQYDYETTFKLFKQYFIKNYNSIISNLFYGMYNSMMTCLRCSRTTHNVQCFNILIFPLEEVRKYKNKLNNTVDIIECFEYYRKQDYMKNSNQIYCNNCKAMSNSNNKTEIIIGPNVLVINLNRGKGLEFNVKINFSEYLDIKNFIDYKEASPTFYELIGIVTHFGPSSMSGHFIAFCKSFVDNQWYKYNDTQVNHSSFQEARSTGVPYILFYSYIKR